MTPQELNLPISEWRAGQFGAVLNSRASTKRFVGHSAPPGMGKTWVLLGESQMSGQRTLILTGTKELQNQYTKLAKSLGLVDVRGKSNYNCRATELGGEFYDGSEAKTVDKGPCQSEEFCSLRENGCTYYDILRRAAQSRLVISNYAAWISANLYTDGWGYFPLVMMDESHEAVGWLTGQLTVKIPAGYEAALHLHFPEVNDPVIWAAWAGETLPYLQDLLKQKKRLRDITPRNHKNYLAMVRMAEQLVKRARMVDEDWIVNRDNSGVIIQPVKIAKYSESLLFNYAKKVVFSSATMNEMTLVPLGVRPADLDLFEYESTFPVERRPVYYYPVVPMRYGMDAEDNLSWITVVDEIIASRLDRKGIIHTGSFARQQQLLSHSQYKHLMVFNSPNDNGSTTTITLQKYRAARAPSLLATPSMTTGVSLDGKQCEYTIIIKVPFENITDPLYLARSEKNPRYGIARAADVLQQAVGRAMRSEMDQNECFILDALFGKIYMNGNSKLLSNYFWESFQEIHDLPLPLQRLE